MSVSSLEMDKSYYLKINRPKNMSPIQEALGPAEEFQLQSERRFFGMSPPPGISKRVTQLRRQARFKRVKSAPALLSRSDEMERKFLRQRASEEINTLVSRAVDELGIISNTIEFLKEDGTEIENYDTNLLACSNIINLLIKLKEDREFILEDIEVEEVRVKEIQRKFSSRVTEADDRLTSLTKAMNTHGKEMSDDLWAKVRLAQIETKSLQSQIKKGEEMTENLHNDRSTIMELHNIIQEKIDMEVQVQVESKEKLLALDEVVHRYDLEHQIALSELEVIENQVDKENSERNASRKELCIAIQQTKKELDLSEVGVISIEKKISSMKEAIIHASKIREESEVIIEEKFNERELMQEKFDRTLEQTAKVKKKVKENLQEIDAVSYEVKIMQKKSDQSHKLSIGKLKANTQHLKMTLAQNKDLKLSCRRLDNQIDEWNKREENDRISINALKGKIQRMERSYLSHSEECARLATKHQGLLLEISREHQAHMRREASMVRELETSERRLKEEQIECQRCRDKASHETESRLKKVRNIHTARTKALDSLKEATVEKEAVYITLQRELEKYNELFRIRMNLETTIATLKENFDKTKEEVNNKISNLAEERLLHESQIKNKMMEKASAERRRRILESSLHQKEESTTSLGDLIMKSSVSLKALTLSIGDIKNLLERKGLRRRDLEAHWDVLVSETTERYEHENSEISKLQHTLDEISSDLIDAEILCKELRINISLMEYDNVKLKNDLNNRMDVRVELEQQLKDQKELFRRSLTTNKSLEIKLRERRAQNASNLMNFKLEGNRNTATMRTIRCELQGEIKTINRFMDRIIRK